MRNRRAGTRALVAATLLLLTGCGDAGDNRGPVSGFAPVADAPVALVYRGPASCDGCAEAVAVILEASERDFIVRFVGPGEEADVTPETLARADLYVQPGGGDDVDEAMRDLGLPATSAIRAYVEDGGRYLGFCMGAYLAGSDPGMGLLHPGDTGAYADLPGADATTVEDTVLEVAWGDSTRLHFAQDPPYLVVSGVPGEQILSRFSGGEVNALVRPLGEGAVGVVGTHPEADRDWYSDELWTLDTDGLDHENALELINAVMDA
ncbi:MAG: BPL-N domain-containing protein [Leucobacter sp.]